MIYFQDAIIIITFSHYLCSILVDFKLLPQPACRVGPIIVLLLRSMFTPKLISVPLEEICGNCKNNIFVHPQLYYFWFFIRSSFFSLEKCLVLINSDASMTSGEDVSLDKPGINVGWVPFKLRLFSVRFTVACRIHHE